MTGIRKSFFRLLPVLMAFGLAGCGDDSSTAPQVTASGPQAAFTVSGEQQAGKSLSFDAAGSEGSSLSFAWRFGDGSTATGRQVTHAYASAGGYQVELVVTDGNGRSDTANRRLDIAAQPAPAGPKATFTTSGTATEGEPVAFDAGASTGTGLVYHWDFGDGDSGKGERIAHVYDQSGTYTASLTVIDAEGGKDSGSSDVEIAAGPQPANLSGAISGTVTVVGGAPLDGVTVTLVNATELAGGTRQATSDAQGAVSLNQMPSDIPIVLSLHKNGYADQFVRTVIPAGTSGARFEAVMVPREAPQTLPDAETGGTVAGTEGVLLELPPNALVDAAGNPVSGDIQVSLTPVDVSDAAELGAFPGSFEAADREGDNGQLVSYGVAEFELRQGGESLQLAAGKQARLLVPIYAAQDLAGNPLQKGDSIPLWSLDESTGQWVQEGTGTVVESAASPTGLAFEIRVGHFSWYNCDDFIGDPYYPIPKCKVSSSSGLPTLDTSETCYIQGRIAGNGPQSRVGTNIPGDGGIPLPVPSGVDYELVGSARNGTLQGKVTVNGTPGIEEQVEIVLTPVNGGGSAITLPYEDVGTIDPAGETDRYTFTGQAGQVVRIEVGATMSSTLDGEVALIGPGGATLRQLAFTEVYGYSGSAVIFAELAQDGTHAIEISATANAPGAYRLGARTVSRIALDQNIQGSVPVDGGSAWFAFEGTADTVIGIRNVANNNTRMQVWNLATGTQVASAGGYSDTGLGVLPQDGMYILEMEDFTLNGTAEDYRTAVARIEAPTVLTPDSAGRSVVNGAVDVHGDRHFYRFTAQAGDGLFVRLDQGSGTPLSAASARIRVYRPDGSLYYEAMPLNVADTYDTLKGVQLFSLGLALPGTGLAEEYLLEVDAPWDGSGTELGDYRLQVDVVQSGAALVVDDDLGQCANADAHSLHAAVYAVQDGGTLDVCAGRYEEYLPLLRHSGSVQITGRSETGVVLAAGDPQYQDVIGEYDMGGSISVASLTLELGDSLTGAYLAGLTNVSVRSDTPADGSMGELIIDKDNTVVDGLDMTAGSNALQIYDADNVTVRNSSITGTPGSITAEFSNNLRFENNTLTMTNAGSSPIEFQDAGGLQFIGNTITASARNPDDFSLANLMYLHDDGTGASATTIRGNTIDTEIGGMQLYARGAGGGFVVEQNRITATNSRGGQLLTAMVSHVDAQGTATLRVRNNLFDAVAPFRGGLHIQTPEHFQSVEIINNTLRAPDQSLSASTDSGMVEINTYASPAPATLPVNFVNNILEGAGDAEGDGSALFLTAGSAINADNNLIHDFGTAYNGGSAGMNDLIGVDPLLTGPLLELSGSSPAIDAGQAAVAGGPPIPAEDYDGTARPQGATVDIGAQEYQP